MGNCCFRASCSTARAIRAKRKFILTEIKGASERGLFACKFYRPPDNIALQLETELENLGYRVKNIVESGRKLWTISWYGKSPIILSVETDETSPLIETESD